MEKFRTSIRGYNKKDVNSFVNEVIEAYEDILKKLRLSVSEMEHLNKELARYKSLEKSLNDAIMVAGEASATAQKAAINEGKMIIEEAKKNASKIVNNSLMKAQDVEREAEDLRRRVISYKRRFASLVESQLDDINNFDERL